MSCNGRLRVTDRELIGTIVMCPQCGSMVQIELPDSASKNDSASENHFASESNSASQADVVDRPPARSAPPPMVVGNENVDSQEITEEGLELPGIVENEMPVNGFSGQGFSGAPPIEPGLGSDFGDTPSSLTSTTNAGDTGTHQEGDPNDAGAGHGDDDPNSFVQPAPKSHQKIAALVAGGCSIAVVGLLGVMWWLSPGTPTTTTMVSGSTNPELSNTEPDASPEIVPPQSVDDPEAVTTTDASSDTESANTPSVTPTTDPGPSQTSDVATSDASATPAESETTPMNSLIPADLLPPDPLAPLPGDPAASSDGPSVVPKMNDAPAEDPLMDLPPELDVFTKLLDLPGDAPDAPPGGQPDAVMPDVQLERAAEEVVDPMLIATPPDQVNVEVVLKTKVAIQTKGYPLADFTLFASEITQIPIQLDWVSMDLVGIEPTMLIRDPVPGWKPIGNLIESVASQAGLSLEKDDSRMTLTVAPDELTSKLKDCLSVDDFGAEQQSASEVIAQLQQQAGVDGVDAIHLQSFLTDSLRRMRALPAKINDEVSSRWTINVEVIGAANDGVQVSESLPELWTPLTEGESGNQLDTSITIAGLLRRTARLNQATCIVNWNDAQRRRLSPGQLVMPYAGDPAGVMLGKALQPVGLQVRVVDRKHWWVGTPATYDRLPIVVRGEELGPRRDDILTRIRVAANTAGARIALQHDVVSDRYLAILPRFFYRQLPNILQPFRSTL